MSKAEVLITNSFHLYSVSAVSRITDYQRNTEQKSTGKAKQPMPGAKSFSDVLQRMIQAAE